jgi:phosphoribosylformylglycinamidine cyclo-ligase
VPDYLASTGNPSRQDDAYARAGVDLAARNDLVGHIKKIAARSSRPEVISGVGLFGALFKLASYEEPVLVSSVDGVGTKIRIAQIMGRYDTVGADIVHHSVNDILTAGAHPLFFLDYIGSSDLAPARKLSLIESMSDACTAHGCALIGGETADMPDVYQSGDFDLVGFIVGIVERPHVIDGSRIRAGDVILGLPSNGLHTNGYSLVRKIFGIGVGGDRARDRQALAGFSPPLQEPLGEALLAVHTSYYHALAPVLTRLHGMAHITGGGIIDNVPRILPDRLAAWLDAGSWRVPEIFTLIQEHGALSDAEMYRAFNMGLGMLVIVAPDEAEAIRAQVRDARPVGRIVAQQDTRKVIIE